ncbi:MAG: hypothetical protein WDA07_03430 [Leucobacter sp.]
MSTDPEDDGTRVVPRAAPDTNDDVTIVAPARFGDAGRGGRGIPHRPVPLVEPVQEDLGTAERVRRGREASAQARVYGARSEAAERPQETDTVERTIGAPPPAVDAPPAVPRAVFPSQERRFRRGRIITLVVYVAVIVGAVAGLWAVARLALE